MDETELGETRGAATSATNRPSVPSPTLARGSALGRYIVLAKVGQGGMGVVYAGYDPELDRKVAIKLLHPTADDASETQGRARLVREAQSLARLQHPEVLTVHDVGEHDGRVFVAMEFVEGRTLRTWLREAPRAWRDVLAVFVAASRGLLAAHEKGLVHRDFKPDNVMLDVEPRTGAVQRVRVMDFGLARESGLPDELDTEGGAARARSDGLTRPGAIVGTLGYLAPEQYRGEPIDARSDQFAFCVALWEGLFGERPFVGSTHAAVVAALAAGPPRATAGAAVPSWLREVVARGLAIDPAARWPSMRELSQALRDDPTGRRRRRWVVAIASATLIGGLGFSELRERSRLAACEADSRALERQWNDARGDVETALLATGASHAPRTVALVDERIDARVEAWRSARLESCVERPNLDERTAGLQDDCFAALREELGDRIDILAHADQAILNRAVGLLGVGMMTAPCMDRAQLQRRASKANTLASPEQIAELRGRIARAGILETAGEYEDALQLATDALASAVAIDEIGLVAAARHRRGRVLNEMARFPESERELTDSFFEALRGGDEALATEGAVVLTALVGANLARRDDGMLWGRQAELLIELHGDPSGELEGSLAHSLGLVSLTAGDYADAVAQLERALALRVAAHGEHSLLAIRALKSLGAAYERHLFTAEALAHLERAVELSEEMLGPDHPLVADARNDLAVALLGADRGEEAIAQLDHAARIYEAAGLEERMALTYGNLALGLSNRGKHEEALAITERALAINERTRPPGHPSIADNLINRASLLQLLGRPAEAVPIFERGLAIYEASYGPEHERVSDASFNLSRALFEIDAVEEAWAAVRRALEIRRKVLRPGHPKIDTAVIGFGMIGMAAGEPRAVLAELEATLAEHNQVPRAPRTLAQLQLVHADAVLVLGDAAHALELLGVVQTDLLDPADVARFEFVRGRALWTTGDREAGRALAQKAAAKLRETGDGADAARIEAWLAAPRERL